MMDEMMGQDIARVINLPYFEGDDIVDCLVEKSKYAHIDIFPMTITDVEKHQQCEIFYQKCLDGDLSKKEFEKKEQKYHECMRTLWLYNDVYVTIYPVTKKLKKAAYMKYNKKLFQNNIKTLQYIADESQSGKFMLVKDMSIFDSILFLATREIASVCMYFQEYKLLVYINTCHALFFTEDAKTKHILESIVLNVGLYIRESEIPD